MRVAHVVPVFPPYRSGTGSVAFHQARCLASAGVEVSVFTTRTSATPPVPAGVKVETLKPLLVKGNAACLPQIVRRTSDHDIVHLHYPFFGTAEIITLKRILTPRPRVVLQYHFDVVGQSLAALAFRCHRRLLLPIVLRGTDAIVVTSMDYAASSFLRSSLARLSSRLVVIPPGVDLARFCPGDAPTPAACLGIGNRPLLFFLASLDRAHYFKGLPVLFDALRELPEVVLVVGGEGELRPSYQSEAVRRGLAERVRFVGSIGDELLPEYFRAADVVVLPSIDGTEAFGLVLLEAMASATPVVASRLPGVRTLVQEGHNGYLAEPGNAADLAAAIRRCLEHAPDLGANARKMMEAGYSWEATTQRLLALYEKVIAYPSG